MAIDQIAQTHYRRSALTTQRVVAAVLALWRATGPSGFRDELTRAAGLVAAGQLAQAVQAAAYLIDLAVEQNLGAAEAVVNPRALSGVAASGRALADVLSYPVNRTWRLLESGADFATAEQSGLASLTRIAGNEITQAGVTAEQVGMVGHPEFDGYVRMVRAPSCGRCAILAGKWFKWNTGFDRHPGCDCVHVAAADKGDALAGNPPWSPDLNANPREYFNSLSESEQNRRFGAAESEAIRKGGDISRAVNTRGLMTPTRRELQLAGKSRPAAIADLTRSGYLTAA